MKIIESRRPLSLVPNLGTRHESQSKCPRSVVCCWLSCYQVLPVILFFAALERMASVTLGGENSEPTTPLEQFKNFVSSPPVIEELIYRRKLPPFRGGAKLLDGSFDFSTNYAFVQVRWQPDTFFYREVNPTNLRSTKIKRRLAGFVSSNYWTIGGTNQPIFRQTLTTNDTAATSFVYAMVQDAMYDASETLNMGVRHLKIGSIRWTADVFAAKSEVQNLSIYGRIVADTNGLPGTMFVSYSNTVNVAEYIIRYAYGTNLGGATELRTAIANETLEPVSTSRLLPQRIRSFLVIKGREYLLEDLTILSLQTSSQLAPLETFSPDAFVEANRLADQIFTNNALFAKEPNGRLRLVQKFGSGATAEFRINFSREVKRTIFLFTLIGLNVGLVGFLGKVARLANNAKQQQ